MRNVVQWPNITLHFSLAVPFVSINVQPYVNLEQRMETGDPELFCSVMLGVADINFLCSDNCANYGISINLAVQIILL